MAGDRRTATSPFTLTKGLAVELLVDVGAAEEVVVPASVVAMTDRTLSVEVASGALGLLIGMTPRCLVLVAGDPPVQAVIARPGRRVDDVHSPTLLELVLDEPAPAPTASA